LVPHSVTDKMHKLIVLLAVVAALLAVAFAMPAAQGNVEIIPSMLVHEEHIPNEGGAAPAGDKTLALFVEELLALRGEKGDNFT
jgi:hypothetical protein